MASRQYLAAGAAAVQMVGLGAETPVVALYVSVVLIFLLLLLPVAAAPVASPVSCPSRVQAAWFALPWVSLGRLRPRPALLHGQGQHWQQLFAPARTQASKQGEGSKYVIFERHTRQVCHSSVLQ